MSLNKVMLIGNVGKDPEVRYLDGNSPAGQGRKVASFTLATSEKYRDRSGEVKENTEWHNIVVWGQSADIVERYVKKGTQLYVEGRLRTRSWTDQSGAKRYTTEINADSLQLLGRRDDSAAVGQSAGYQGGNQPVQAPQPAQQSTYQPPVQQTQQGTWGQPSAAPQTSATGIDNQEDDLPF